ncbi:hypothetical protein ACFFX0_33300 [Citricoccus parietis]|uniref:Uncharacterized protein n=1 Tax=Citricoccus parietis TaxID=592307 RepID=A0ABV5GA02_9MICC
MLLHWPCGYQPERRIGKNSSMLLPCPTTSASWTEADPASRRSPGDKGGRHWLGICGATDRQSSCTSIAPAPLPTNATNFSLSLCLAPSAASAAMMVPS